MKTLLAIGLTAVLPAGAFAETWQATGPRGTTSSGEITCAHSSATLTCERAAVVALPSGTTLDRTASRISDATGTAKVITTAGPKGRNSTTTHSRSRGD